MVNIREMVERFKVKSEYFFKSSEQVFIIDVDRNYYWCDILSIEENYIQVLNFKGKRKSEKSKIYWSDIIRLDKYRNQEEIKRW